MKNTYLESILFFGLIIPAVCLGLIYFTCSKFLNSDKKKLAAQEAIYQQDQVVTNQVEKLKASTREQNIKLNKWLGILNSEASEKITQSLKKSSEKYGDEMKQSSFSRSRSNTFASALTQPNSAWDFTLRGTFRGIQKSLLQLEHENPQLLLESMSLKPNTSDNSLSASITYSAWTTESQ